MNIKSEKKQTKYNHEKGTVLAIALLLTIGMLILSMPFLTKLSGHYRVSENSYRSFAAMNLAEAGLERAIWELNYGDISSWDGDDLLRTFSIPSVQAPGGSIIGDILITVATPAGDNPIVESTGQIDVSDNVHLSKTARAVLKKHGGDALFNVGVFAEESLTLAANLNIEGDVGVNGTHPGALTIGTNSVVSGDAYCGPGGDPFVAINLNGSAQVLGQQSAAAEIKNFPSVPLPEGMDYRGELNAQGNLVEITESGEYTSFVLETGAVAEITGDVTLYISGIFSLGSNTELRIAEGGHLTLVLSGSLYLDSNCAVNNSLEDPTRLVILGTDSLTGTIHFESNTPFYGAVYLPQADLVFSSNIDFHGSAIGKSMVLNSNVDLSYAQELQDIEGLPAWDSLFIVKSWQEKRPQQ
ncbi:hypothetical protein ACFLQZ_01180 [Acidobacteriota bacterium]